MSINLIQNNKACLIPSFNKQRRMYTNKSDGVSFSGNFSKLEKQALKAVRAYSLNNNVETCRIIKNAKDITNRFDIIETVKSCKACPKLSASILKMYYSNFIYKHSIKNSTYIHSHTCELPLSPDDILAALNMKIKKMVSITSKGKYMSVEFDKKSQIKAQEMLPSLFDKTHQKYNEMTLIYGDEFFQKDKVHMQEYANFALDTLKDFFKKTGLKVDTNFY